MSIQVKFFGVLADAAKKKEFYLENITDTELLRKKILSDFPDLGKQSFVIAVNKKIAKGNVLINAGDIVALLPPFAGG